MADLRKLTEKEKALYNAQKSVQAQKYQQQANATNGFGQGLLDFVAGGEKSRSVLGGLLGGDTSALKGLLGEVKQLGDPEYMRQFDPMTTDEAIEIAMSVLTTSGNVSKALLKHSNLLDDFTKVNIGGRDVLKHNITGNVIAESKFPSGITKYEALDHIKSVNPITGQVFEFLTPFSGKSNMYDNIDDAFNSIRGQKISSALTKRNENIYGKIPKLWSGEAKKVAKEIIDNGYDVNKFSASTQSNSKYLELSNGTKIRLSDHKLPSHYDSPDLNHYYGDDINMLLQSLKKINENS